MADSNVIIYPTGTTSNPNPHIVFEDSAGGGPLQFNVSSSGIPTLTLSSSTKYKQAIAKRSAGIAIWDMGERSLLGMWGRAISFGIWEGDSVSAAASSSLFGKLRECDSEALRRNRSLGCGECDRLLGIWESDRCLGIMGCDGFLG